MARFEKRRKFENFFYTRTAVVILALVAVLFGLSVISVFEKRHEAAQNAHEAEYEVQTLSARQAKTEQSIKTLNTDAGVEEAIRNKYRAAKDGEGLVVIMDQSQTETVRAPQPQVPQTWWQKFISFFK
jgi:cell division protein FtsB